MNRPWGWSHFGDMMIDILRTHSIARRTGKPPFFFSRFNFEQMRELGNTHYCFVCLSRGGYRPDINGTPTNVHEDDQWALKDHEKNHAPYVIGNADKYKDVWSWLGTEIPSDFPYLVTVPALP